MGMGPFPHIAGAPAALPIQMGSEHGEIVTLAAQRRIIRASSTMRRGLHRGRPGRGICMRRQGCDNRPARPRGILLSKGRFTL